MARSYSVSLNVLSELPPRLAAGLDALLAAHDRHRLEAAAVRLSDAYRAQGASASRAARTPEDAAAYAAYRAPATYAAAAAVFGQIRLRRPNWEPRSVLDLGAGPGVTSWAAATVWPGIEQFTLVEAESEMSSLGRSLATAAPGALAGARWVQGDAATDAGQADLVVASYVLGEVDARRFDAVTGRLWSSTRDTAVVVEPGTPAGYARVIGVRQAVVASGGFTIAPCPHDGACPLQPGDWCHFATRLPRGEAHRTVKNVSRGFEDEKFSYAAFSRVPAEGGAARIIRPPLLRSGHVHLDVCGPDGIGRRIVSRRDKELYRAARDLRWGDAAPSDMSPPPRTDTA
jgi:ribosomal protein RSM22 (predicted rRNA methylase)